MDGQYLPDDSIDIDSLASSEPPEYVPQMFSEGGEVEEEDIEYFANGGEASVQSMNEYLLSDEEGATPEMAQSASYDSESAAPEMNLETARSMMRKLAAKGGGKSSRSKEMSMELSGLVPAIPELGAPQTEQEKLTQIATARAQYDALEQAYKLKAQAAQRAGKGLTRSTFSGSTFNQPTLEKAGPLMARTFQAGGLVRALKSGAKKGASSADNVVPSSARSLFSEDAPSFLPSIIKEEGGNWMGGSTSPESFVKPLYKAENLDNPAKAKSLNKWIDKKLTPYIKNKMGTPSDPVRKLADEEGILPIPRPSPLEAMLLKDRANMNRSVVRGVDQSAPVSTTPAGQVWENLTDSAIEVGTYKDMIPGTFRGKLALTPDSVEGELRRIGGDFAVQNPNAPVSGMRVDEGTGNIGYRPQNFGFDHIVDVLQEDLTTGRLSPDSLRGLSMEDAVRRTFDYDQEMAKKMAESSIQALKGVPTYKAYPEQGFRWMQLDKPGYFAAESDAMGHSVRGYEPPPGHPDWTPQSGNKGSPGYGSGGWEAIKSGDVKVYSLADDMGKRYTTIEQVPSMHPLGTSGRGNNFPDEIRYGGSGTGVEESIPKEKLQEIYALGKKMYFENPNAFAENRLLSGAPAPSPMDSFQKAADMVLGKRPPSINQIKGQVNGYIAEDAQPFVQDFLNSGNWSTVNDLHLAGLKDLRDNPDLENFVRTSQLDNRRFLTKNEYDRYEGELLRPVLKRQLGGFDPLAPVERAGGSPIGGEQRLTPQQIERIAAEQAALNTYQPVMNRNIQRQGERSRKLAGQRDVSTLPDPQTYAFIESALFGTPPDEVANKFGVFHPRRKDILSRAEQGFVTGNAALVGPAARMLKEVTAPAVKYLGKEAARQVERGIFNEGPLRGITPQPAFAVRPEGGGTTFTGVQSTGKSNASISKLDKMIDAGANPGIAGLSNEMGDAIENFWRSKGQNYLTRQYGTPSDPIFKQIISGQLRTPALQKQIPDYAIEQTKVGKTRVDPVTGETRFYPKHPQALEDLTRRYDEMTGLRGLAFNTKEPLFDPAYPSTMGDRGQQLQAQLTEDVTEKMVAGGMNPNLINPNVTLTGPRGDNASDLINYIPSEYKELYNLYKQPPEESNMINRIYKELGIGETKVPGVVPENIKRAIETSEPIYDVDLSMYRNALGELLSPRNINQYLATLSPKEITKMRFEDVVKNSARYNLDMFNTQNLVEAIRAGKRIPEKTWRQGLSEPLMNFEKEGKTYTWHRIMDNEATALEGAYLGHSVGGYAKGGNYGAKEYRLFKEGAKEVYTLRDTRGRPFTTVEVEKTHLGPLDRILSYDDVQRAKAEGRDLGPVVTVLRQTKGNGAKTGNVAPKDVDDGVLTFIRDYIKPDKFTEKDQFLTPKLEQYKIDLSGRPRP